MTDRHRTLVVVLEQDTRSDDIEDLRKTLLSIRGIERVELGPAVGVGDHYVRVTLVRKLASDLREFLDRWIKENG